MSNSNIFKVPRDAATELNTFVFCTMHLLTNTIMFVVAVLRRWLPDLWKLQTAISIFYRS